MTCTACTLRIAGLLERIGELEQEIATARSDAADLRTELRDFAAAVAAAQPSTRHDDDLTKAESPTSRAARGRETQQLPRETMAQVIDGRLR